MNYPVNDWLDQRFMPGYSLITSDVCDRIKNVHYFLCHLLLSWKAYQQNKERKSVLILQFKINGKVWIIANWL